MHYVMLCNALCYLRRGAAAFRVDFFVRWGREGQPASLFLNEVELGFSAGAVTGWFGAPLADLI